MATQIQKNKSNGSLSYKLVDSPVGVLKLVASEKGLVAILWEKDNPLRVRISHVMNEPLHPVLVRTEKELNEYFEGSAARLLCSSGYAWYALSKTSLGSIVGHPIWGNQIVWRPRRATRKSGGQSGSRSGKRSKPDCYHCSVPPCHWCDRQAARFRWRARSESSPLAFGRHKDRRQEFEGWCNIRKRTPVSLDSRRLQCSLTPPAASSKYT